MASTYSTSLQIQLIGNGEQSGFWGTTTNTNWNLVEQAIAGVVNITMANTNYTLSVLNGVSDEARNMVLVVGGTNSAIRQVVAPLVPKVYIVSNNTVGGYAINIGGATGNVVSIPNGATTLVYCDGTNFNAGLTGAAGVFTAGSFSGAGTGLTGIAAALSIGGNAGTATTAGSATTATTATNIAGGAANQIPVQSAPGTTTYIPVPTVASTSLTWNGTTYVWASGGGGAVAGGAVYENSQIISANYTMTSGKSGESVGPIIINSGVTVTIPSGSRWVVL